MIFVCDNCDHVMRLEW